MHFRFFPLGIPISSSIALRAGHALTADNTPATASRSEIALSPVGPTGSAYKIVSGSNVVVI